MQVENVYLTKVIHTFAWNSNDYVFFLLYYNEKHYTDNLILENYINL